MAFERDHDHVVDRDQRPHDQHEAEQRYPDLLQKAPPPRGAAHPLPVGVGRQADIGGCCGQNFIGADLSMRISRMTSGMTSGSAVITAATPRRGCALSKAYCSTPSVANTCVDIAGPPPEMKYTVVKSPTVKIVDSNVQTK